MNFSSHLNGASSLQNDASGALRPSSKMLSRAKFFKSVERVEHASYYFKKVGNFEFET